MLKTEPVAVAAAVRALLVCAVAFGAELTGEQIAGVILVVETFSAFLIRSLVTPVGKEPPQDPPSTRRERKDVTELASYRPPPGAACAALLVLLVGSGCSSTLANEPEPCDLKTLGVITARCRAEVALACRTEPGGQCPAAQAILQRCDAEIDAWESRVCQ